MAAKNDITGDSIASKVLSEKGRANWDSIFKKHSAWDWLKELGPDNYQILDPDGWRYDDGVTLDTPITKSDFDRRFNRSTVMCKMTTIENEN
jgi:hypothetical protein